MKKKAKKANVVTDIEVLPNPSPKPKQPEWLLENSRGGVRVMMSDTGVLTYDIHSITTADLAFIGAYLTAKALEISKPKEAK